MRTIEILFWTLFFIVFYTYLGYGLLLSIVAKIKEIFYPGKKSELYEINLPEVTLLIAAYNEEQIIPQKMENTLNLNYPKELLKIVWVTDGSNDKTNEYLSNYPEVTILHEALRKGKTAAINRAMNFITTPVVVFTDANTILNNDAIIEIVKPFEDSMVGCVAGEKRVSADDRESASGGEGIYWKYESLLKSYDSRLFSVVGAAGELYAIRREHFLPLRPDTLLDDFQLSLSIANNGFPTKYCKGAFATESGSLNIDEERKRKIRIAAGGIQAIIRMPRLLNFFKHPILTFQYFSHRVLRWSITPIALLMLIPANLFLAFASESAVYSVLLFAQIFFYIGGFAGYILRNNKIRLKILFVPYYFLFMNFSVFAGVIYLIKKRKADSGVWEKAKRKD
jgi:cellulose synthase/poly-beta-1,6-N-acetylglucosamine synthase-like glycosyltransferase